MDLELSSLVSDVIVNVLGYVKTSSLLLSFFLQYSYPVHDIICRMSTFSIRFSMEVAGTVISPLVLGQISVAQFQTALAEVQHIPAWKTTLLTNLVTFLCE